ncbi:hypothetical protein ALI22I_24080 [Saccharothrix sp. ALI-22-I]|uniref:hypothetical protein n=1 Tax=Saccharothrix sp. ALI-22-I TaxID=1933778 RepID=UPI00097CB424|nr:hypothetical protein [Saccharothrix sp. ALI-22-I]ONI86704.1 hypothetical protein ALI22I_24080 [Saccharothrix sp. ALI-22-I]
MSKPAQVESGYDTDEEFTEFIGELAREGAPQPFAIVEEYGERDYARVAGYGLAYDDRADVNSVEGDFRLVSDSVERALMTFEISTGDAEVRQLHVVWLNGSSFTDQVE